MDIGWTALLSTVIPFLVSFLKDRTWPDWAKQGLCLAFALLAATISGVLTEHISLHALNVELFLGSVGWAFMEAQAIYKLIKPTSVNQTLTDIKVLP